MIKSALLVVLAATLLLGMAGCGTVPGIRTTYDGVSGVNPYKDEQASRPDVQVAMIPASNIGLPMSVTKAGSYWSLENTRWGFAIAFSLEEIPPDAVVREATVWLRKKSYHSDRPVAQIRVVNVNKCLHITRAMRSDSGRKILEYSIVDDDRRLWDGLSRGMTNADLINFKISGGDGTYRDFLLSQNPNVPATSQRADAWDRVDVEGFVISELGDDRRLSLFVDHGAEGSFDIEYYRKNVIADADPVLVVEYTVPGQAPASAQVVPSASATVAERLLRLESLLENGLITSDEYEVKRGEILGSI